MVQSVLVQRRLGRIGHARAGLGAEVLDDDFLDVAVALVDVADGQQRLDALGARLADADQEPVVNGTRARPAASSVARRTAGVLSGEPKCGPPRSRQRVGRRLQHDALRDGDLRSRRSQPSSMTPGLRCGSRPVSCSTSAAEDSR